MAPRPTPEQLAELRVAFRAHIRGKIPFAAIEDVTEMAIRVALWEIEDAIRSGEPVTLHTSPYIWAEDLAGKSSFMDCVGFYALMDPRTPSADVSKWIARWLERFRRVVRQRFVPLETKPRKDPDGREHQDPGDFADSRDDRGGFNSFDPSGDEEPDDQHLEEPTDYGYEPDTGLPQSPVTVPLGQLDLAELEAVCESAVSGFFNPNHLIPFLREGGITIQPEDVLDARAVLAKLSDNSLASRFLSPRATELIQKLGPGSRGYRDARRTKNDEALKVCLRTLNVLINDDLVWPEHCFDPGLLSQETLNLRNLAEADTRTARRYRRLVLNDVLAGFLSPRLGYSPRIGTFRTFVVPALLNRFRDARDRQLTEKYPRRSDVAEAVRPGILTPDLVPDPAGFLDAILHPRNSAQQRWLTQLQADSPAPERQNPPNGQVQRTDIIDDLNRLIARRAVFQSADRLDTTLPPRLRTLCCVWTRFDDAFRKPGDPTRTLMEAIQAFNHRALAIAFPKFVRPAFDQAPDASPSSTTKTNVPATVAELLQELLENPRVEVFLDLTLTAKVPPRTFGNPTLLDLEFGNARERTRTPTPALQELLGLLQDEHRYLVARLQAIQKEQKRLKELCEYDEAILEQSRSVAGKLRPEVLTAFHTALHGSQPGEIEPLPTSRTLVKILTLARETPEAGLRAAVNSLQDANVDERHTVFNLAHAARRLKVSQSSLNLQETALAVYQANKPPWTRSQADVALFLGCHQGSVSRNYASALKPHSHRLNQIIDAFEAHRLGPSTAGPSR